MIRLVLRFACVGCLVSAVQAQDPPWPSLRERFAASAGNRIVETPDFRRHVVPLFGRLGCNGRSCHGSFQGQGGFRLSMFGYDFAADLAALQSGDAPRIDVKRPDESLILAKPSSDDDHGGGKRFDLGGWEHRVLRRWIAAGAQGATPDGSYVTRLAVAPSEILFREDGEATQLKVVAHWSDGVVEDVAPISRYASNDDAVAKIDADGRVVSTGRGATYVIVCYDDRVESVPVLRAVSDRVGPRYPAVPTPTKIDDLVVAKLHKLGIVPSELCTDAEFLRRASLDVCGTLPTPPEVETFLADTSSDKRARKIDELLARPEYSVWWATLLCDLTGLNSGSELGGTDYAKDFGEQWYAWIERRLRENVGYAELARGIVTAVSRKPTESYEEFVARQVSYLRTKQPVDFTAQPSMPHFWSRNNLATTDDKALAFAHVFLGVRLDCAQCHKHPFDRWSQQDFRDFAAIFERVAGKGVHPAAAADKRRLEEALNVASLKTAATRRQTFRKWAGEGKPSIFQEVHLAPPTAAAKNDDRPAKPKTLRVLGGEPLVLDEGRDPREPLMQWMLAKDNPYFGPAMVNRVWAHYFGIGIVSPADDFNLGNPPSNRELLDHLSRDFIEHGYDLKRLHRAILNSRTYQLSCRTNETNRNDERLFSTRLVRRLPAEAAADALRQATAMPAQQTKVGTSALSTRYIAQQPPAYERRLDYSMLVFGKPIRKTNCDCERQVEPSLLQAVYLRNDVDLQTSANRADGWLRHLPADAKPAQLVREAYLRTVSRPPTDAELTRCVAYFDEAATPAEALEDVVWALLNTQEFITNH